MKKIHQLIAKVLTITARENLILELKFYPEGDIIVNIDYKKTEQNLIAVNEIKSLCSQIISRINNKKKTNIYVH